MKKFTVFTIILSTIVVVVFAEIVLKDYLPNSEATSQTDSSKLTLTLPKSLDLKKSLATNVLGADTSTTDLTNHLGADSQVITAPLSDTPVSVDNNPQLLGNALPANTYVDNTAAPTNNTGDAKTIKDFEDVGAGVSVAAPTATVYLRDEQIKSAGFTDAYLQDETFDGYVFKTIAVNDLTDTKVIKTDIRTKDTILAKDYIFKVGLNTNVNEFYDLLKLRASQTLGVKINETNEFGAASFYMNDPSRPGVVFLTVRIGGLIYSFSYPKDYHSQIKNLIKLIEWELG